MRLSLLLSLVLTAVLTTTAWSQTSTAPQHPANPDAERIGSFEFHVEVDSQSRLEKSLLGNDGGIVGLVTVFRSEERTDYMVSIESVKFLGAIGLWIDITSTPALANLISRTVVLQGIALGYTGCPTTCGTEITGVYMESCVKRSGSGLLTHFIPCAPTFGMREYKVCCPNLLAGPQIEMIRYLGEPCSADVPGECEFTGP